MSTSDLPLVYAELLPHIRQVSVGCSLPSPVSASTRIEGSSDGLRLTINHDGVQASIGLPAKVVMPSRLRVPPGNVNFSLRLPLDSTAQITNRPSVEGHAIPWSAHHFESGMAIKCRGCEKILVKEGQIQVWKDLPSENWAEMMEFWHCHKPHDHGHKDDEALASKGYGASSRISAQPGTGFVDLTSFLLSKTDVSSESFDHEDSDEPTATEISGSPRDPKAMAICCSCKREVGVFNGDLESVSLFKWQITIKSPKSITQGHQPTLGSCVSAMLTATMARTGCSKSIIFPMKTQLLSSTDEAREDNNQTQQSLLHIWVFNASIRFSSTAEGKSPMDAVKVFFRRVSESEANKMLDSMVSDVQDITLPPDAITMLSKLLQRSNSLLPRGDRQFKDWEVGLIERWSDETA